MPFGATLSEFTVCAVVMGVFFGPPLYAWCDRWLDRTRGTAVDVMRTEEET